MEKQKKQNYLEGSFVKIELSNGVFAIGRLMHGIASTLGVYDCLISDEKNCIL